MKQNQIEKKPSKTFRKIFVNLNNVDSIATHSKYFSDLYLNNALQNVHK